VRFIKALGGRYAGSLAMSEAAVSLAVESIADQQNPALENRRTGAGSPAEHDEFAKAPAREEREPRSDEGGKPPARAK
jgi:hypothetical protein